MPELDVVAAGCPCFSATRGISDLRDDTETGGISVITVRVLKKLTIAGGGGGRGFYSIRVGRILHRDRS